jgi:hypothetical protein
MRRRTALALVALAAAGGVVAAVVVGLGAGDEPSVPPPAGEGVAFTPTISPPHILFGDPVVAELRVNVNEALVTPASVRFSPRFGPFRQLGPAEVASEDLGESTVLTYRYTIQCASRACVPGAGQERALAPPFGILRYAHRELLGVTQSIEWPELTIVSRLELGETVGPTLEVDPDELAPVSYGVSPSLLGWSLIGAAGVIVLGAGAFVVSRLRRPAPELPAVAGSEASSSPLEEALTLVESSLEDGEEQRRTSLDELARVLDQAGHTELARGARRLAWAEPTPAPAAMGELVTRARRALEAAA